ncbi:hypothetical protein V6N13_148084 [Hibiscus sabdariffa]
MTRRNKGVIVTPHIDIKNFRDVLDRTHLWDLKPHRGWSTWHKLGPSCTPMCKCLDKFLTTMTWIETHVKHKVITEFAEESDHFYLLMDNHSLPLTSVSRHHGDYFKFDA